MHIQRHLLAGGPPGTRRELTSLHFGSPGAGPKATLQASLHADEVPPMLVALHLRRLLERLEHEGRIRGEIVLIPAANPIGLGQQVLEGGAGRFDLASGQNFNRHFADLFALAAPRLPSELGDDAPAALARLRRLMVATCDALPAATELESLRKTLLTLAIDADTVLDLHSDNEAVVHLYTTPALWPSVEPLAHALRSPLALLAAGSGDDPFDEACSLAWQRIAAHYGASDHAFILASACVAATAELRGEADVSHALARDDAAALLQFLAQRGHIDGDVAPPAAEPGGPVVVNPLAGSMPVAAPHAGVLIYLRELGASLRAGEPFAEIADPIEGTTTPVHSPIDGIFFARPSRRFVTAGGRIAKISGRVPLRSGKLMSA